MRAFVLVALPLLVIAALVGAFLYTHERREEELFVGYSGEAARNPFYAVELLLEEVGIDAESRATLDPTRWLPPGADTLVLRSHGELAVADRVLALRNWVADAGGHLVLLPPARDNATVEALFAAFGLDLGMLGTGGQVAAVSDRDGAEAYVLNLPYTAPRLEAPAWPDGAAHEDPSVATLADELGYVAVRLPVGNGFVTAVSTSGLFFNGPLDRADHPRLVLDLLAGYVEPGKVWIVYGVDFPSLPALLWQAMPQLTLTLAALLLLWLWTAMPRFGPRVPPPGDDRRSILEHVAASGEFAWRHDGAQALAAAVRHALIEQADRRHPGIGRQPVARQAEIIARLSGRTAAEVRTLLEPVVIAGRPAEFVHIIHDLQRLRKAL